LFDFSETSYGAAAKKAVEHARHQVASLLNCQPNEVIFTSGGTEAINYALKARHERRAPWYRVPSLTLHPTTAFQGAAFAQRKSDGTLNKSHIITSSVEHPAVMETLTYLRDRFNFRLTIISVDQYGIVNPDELVEAITNDTFLVSIMHANNEVGSINPIEHLARLAKAKNPSIIFHTGTTHPYRQFWNEINKRMIQC
jgi:cysteine desulfurase